MVFFVGCNKEEKELKKLQIESEKVKIDIQKLEKDKLIQSYKKQYKIAESEMKLIAYFLESYITDWGKLPDEDSLEMMSYNKKIVPFYIKNIPLVDPWGNKYELHKVPNTQDEYIISSSGSDGEFKGLDQPTDKEWDIGSDIIWKNGLFILGLSKDERENRERNKKEIEKSLNEISGQLERNN